MGQEMMQTNELYDYREYDRIWRKVSPELNPYPQARAEMEQEEQLPGAQEDPCCMGTNALESVGVLAGFVREEQCDLRLYCCLVARCRNPEAHKVFSCFVGETRARVKKLLSALYLITGQPYCPEISCEELCWNSYCELLRALYHAAACGGFNYARAAQETTDPCLQELLMQFSEEKYRQASRILELLAKAL